MRPAIREAIIRHDNLVGVVRARALDRLLISRYVDRRRTPVDLVTDILRITAGVTGVTTREILSKTRMHSVTRARHLAAYALRNSGMSYPEIGRAVGFADHTSAMHAVRKVADDADLRALGNRIAPRAAQPVPVETGPMVLADGSRLA